MSTTSNRRVFIETLESDPVLREVPTLAPRPGEVQIRVHAAALNFADLLKAKGQYQEPEPWPFTPGLEGAGEVLAAGPGSRFQPGDRVAINHPGTLAEIVTMPDEALLTIPGSMTYEQAAGFQIAYGTSHLALTHKARLTRGQRLVVLGAAGGVGLTAVQIGAALGAEVIGVARGTSKLQAVQDGGATAIFDSETTPDLRQSLKNLGGVDVVYDPVGGALGEAAFGALRPGGCFLVIGFAGGRPPALPLNHALVKNISIEGFYWGGYRRLDPDRLRDSLQALFALFEQGRLAPLAHEVLPLARVSEGFERLRTRASVGKIIITL